MEPQSYILRLHAELRNQIYKEALIDSDEIQIGDKELFEPALLTCCKQIRTEAIGIFYCKNNFTIPIKNHDSDILLKWEANRKLVQTEYGVEPQRAKVTLDAGAPNAKNLDLWLERFHQGLAPPPTVISLTNALSDAAVVGAMFLVVLEMKGVEWSEVAKILAVHFFMLMQLDAKWR